MIRTTASPGPLLGIGHSHLGCVARAAATTGCALTALNFWELPGSVRQQEGQPRLATAIEEQLRGHAGPVFSLIGGAAHGVLGMLVHPRRFDFVLADEPGRELDAAAEVLPERAVRGLLEALMAEYFALMSEVARLCVGRLVHIEPPPPSADAARMRADIPWAMYPGMLHEISPAAMRWKLWRLHSLILADQCAQMGVDLLPCPPQAIDDKGFLRDAYYADGAHANPAYGELVLSQMRLLA